MYFKIILLVLLYLSTYQYGGPYFNCSEGFYLAENSTCIECRVKSCLQCSMSNFCSKCKDLHTLVDGICVQCNIENCLQCQNNQVCSKCKILQSFAEESRASYFIGNYTGNYTRNYTGNYTGNYTIGNTSYFKSQKLNQYSTQYKNNQKLISTLYPSSNRDSCVKCQKQHCLSCSNHHICGVCQNGYHLHEGNCYTCSGMGCLECSGHNYCSYCAEGFGLINGKCVICDYPCRTCNQQGHCVTCETPYFVQNTYENVCHPATIPNCVKYSPQDPKICLSCIEPFTLHQSGQQCQIICNSSCLTCNQTIPWQCLSCSEGFYLSQNTHCVQCQVTGCATCDQNVCLECHVGFYPINGQCKACPGYCANCSSGTYCHELREKDGQTLIIQNNETILVFCQPGCKTCSNVNPEICIDCSLGLYLVNGSCKRCLSNCQTCSINNATLCLSCFPNSFLVKDSCITCDSNCKTCKSSTQSNLCTGCYPGYHLQNQRCIEGCSANCQICENESNCTKCSSGYTIFIYNSLILCAPCTVDCRTCAKGLPNVCLSCGDGFYLAGNNTCIPCTQNCKQCSKGICNSCVQGYFITSSQICSVNCKLPCATCSSINPLKCHSCIGGYVYSSLSFTCAKQLNYMKPYSVCPIGYTLSKGKCIGCLGENCHSCKPLDPTQCKSCLPGYHLDTTSSKCKSCLPSCETCLTGSGCKKCAIGYTTLKGVPATSSGHQCHPCKSPCKTCKTSKAYCTSCVEGYEFSGWKCKKKFSFVFNITLMIDPNTFNEKYYTLILELAQALGTTDLNDITINSITFGSVIIQGSAAPSGQSDSEEFTQQFYNFQNTLSTSNQIAGMKVGSYSVAVAGGQIIQKNNNLAIILGTTIPGVVIILSVMAICIYCKKKKKSVLRDPMIEGKDNDTTQRPLESQIRS